MLLTLLDEDESCGKMNRCILLVTTDDVESCVK